MIYNIYTDGACSGNPGPGGWACIIYGGETNKLLWGQIAHTTNNRMELQAVIAGLRYIDVNVHGANVITDSMYIVKAANHYIKDWRKRGWRKSDGKPIANQALIIQLANILNQNKEIVIRHTKGHSGDVGNELADTVAKLAVVGDLESIEYIRQEIEAQVN